MNSTAKPTDDKQIIRQLMQDWSNALEAKDVQGLTRNYLPDALLFDAIPPYKTQGVEAIRQAWEHCLPCFPEQFRSEHRDVDIQVGGDTAFASCLHRFVTEPADHPAGQSWMRVTLGYRRVDGQWKVAHEHVSMPFNPMNNQVWQIKDPDNLNDMPDYSQAS